MLETAIDPYRTTDWSGPIRSFTVKKLSPHIGAEIGNIDLTKPLSDEQVEDLHRAFAQNCVLFFRDQKINFEDQKRLGLYFGEMHVHVGPSTESKALDGDPSGFNNRRTAAGGSLCNLPLSTEQRLFPCPERHHRPCGF